MTAPDLTRRTLGALTVAGASGAVLAACGGGAGADGGTGTATSSPSATPGAALVAAAEVPVGAGVILEDQRVVVTQPAQGDIRAFTAICTHQGCVVSSVEDNVIVCACHGSRFSAEDGSVVLGPATAALAAVEVEVKGGEVVQA